MLDVQKSRKIKGIFQEENTSVLIVALFILQVSCMKSEGKDILKFSIQEKNTGEKNGMANSMSNLDNGGVWDIPSNHKEKEISFFWMMFYICILVIGIGVCIFLMIRNNMNSDDKIDFVVIEEKQKIEPFVFPISDKYFVSITSSQDLRRSLTKEEAGMSTSGLWHNGIDIACPEKTPVLASKRGIAYVVFPSFYNGKQYYGHKVYGGLIILKHPDKTISLYGHLSQTDIVVGEWVEQGQQIGLSGGKKGKRGSGISTGCHLHFLITFDVLSFFDGVY